MARKPEIQYIRYYTDGSAARQLEQPVPQKKKRRPLPQPKCRPKLVLRIQPLAVFGVLVSAVMLIMMIVGAVELFDAQQQTQQMQNHVSTLIRENERLTEAYEAGIDLQEIEKAALALGMVPESEVTHVTISVPMPEPEPETGLWDQFWAFLTGLFA